MPDAERTAYVLKAVLHLLQAKWLFWTRSTPELLQQLRFGRSSYTNEAAAIDADLMRWALGGVSRRLPWRSDCMVQALAARLWLDAAGAPCDFRLGAESSNGTLGAHAWIEVDGKVATGGQSASRLQPFSASGKSAARSPAGDPAHRHSMSGTGD